MANWNPWHGCTKVSTGCSHCYVYRRDAEFGRDASVVHKTAAFNLPIQRNRRKEYKLQPDGDYVYTCFTSDFFHPAADDWRPEAWAMMKARPELDFYFITKRPERFFIGLPEDWGAGYENVHIVCTCENQYMTDKRLPIFLELPICHKEIIHDPVRRIRRPLPFSPDRVQFPARRPRVSHRPKGSAPAGGEGRGGLLSVITTFFTKWIHGI